MRKIPYHKSLRDYVEKYKQNKKERVANYIIKGQSVVLEINCSDINALYNTYSPDNNRDISNDIYNYIIEQAYFVPFEYNIILLLKGDFPKETQEYIRMKMKQHYNMLLEDKIKKVRTNTFKSLGLFSLGMALFFLIYLMTKIDNTQFVRDILSIAATFALWETVNYYILDRRSLKWELYDAAQLAFCDIAFPNDYMIRYLFPENDY